MFRKLTAIFICAVFALAATIPVFAGTDGIFSGITAELYLQLDGYYEGGGHQMRGFAASPDGKHLYAGLLQLNRHVTKFDAATGERLGEYEPQIENDDGVTSDMNYPKSIAVDSRGYMFVGITLDEPKTPYIALACVNPTPDEDGYMHEVSYIIENLGAEHTGINGLATHNSGDKILVYITTGYDKDTIRCYDVTDVNDMHLYSGFGVDGVIDYNDLTGSRKDPGYLTVDADGYLYLCYLADGAPGIKGSHVMKISPDGKTVLKQTEVVEAYGICNAGDYLFVSTYGSKIVILKKADLSIVTEFEIEDCKGAISGCYFADDFLWIGTHGDGTPDLPGEIYRAGPFMLTRDPRETETISVELVTAHAEDESREIPEDGEPYTLFDFSDPDVVSKITGDNDCTVIYDEELQCMKVTVTEDGQSDGCDPYFSLPMSKAYYFDAGDYPIITLRYMTDCYCLGEIYYTTKINRNIGMNHITYDVEDTSEWSDLKIDMREDDAGNWEGEVRTIRIDLDSDGEEGDVFYIKSLSVMAGEKEPAPDTTKAKETKPADTTPSVSVEEPDDTKKTGPAETGPAVQPKAGASFPWWIIIAVSAIVLFASGAFVIIRNRKKQHDKS